MLDVDPYMVVRNSATLQAYRDYHRAARAAAQPWITIAVALALVQIAMFLYALFHNAFRALSLVESLAMGAFGLAMGIAGLRAWSYRRAHPLRLPGI